MTKYQITIDMPNLGTGVEVTVDGIGTLPNGSTTVLTDEQVAAFRTTHPTTNDETGEQEVGPTPLQANWPEGITVETVAEQESTSKYEQAAPKKETATPTKKEQS